MPHTCLCISGHTYLHSHTLYMLPIHPCSHTCPISPPIPVCSVHTSIFWYTCMRLSNSILCMLTFACLPLGFPVHIFTWPYLLAYSHLPTPGTTWALPGPHSHDAAQCPDVRLAAVPIPGDDLRGQEVWGPTEHSGRYNRGLRKAGGPMPDWVHLCSPRETAQSLHPHLWQRPPGPTLAASPRSPIFTSMFLFRKKLPAEWGARHGYEDGATPQLPQPPQLPAPHSLSFRSRCTIRRWCR